MSEHKHVWYLANTTHARGVTGPNEVIVTIKCFECGAIGDSEDVMDVRSRMP